MGVNLFCYRKFILLIDLFCFWNNIFWRRLLNLIWNFMFLLLFFLNNLSNSFFKKLFNIRNFWLLLTNSLFFRYYLRILLLWYLFFIITKVFLIYNICRIHISEFLLFFLLLKSFCEKRLFRLFHNLSWNIDSFSLYL